MSSDDDFDPEAFTSFEGGTTEPSRGLTDAVISLLPSVRDDPVQDVVETRRVMEIEAVEAPPREIDAEARSTVHVSNLPARATVGLVSQFARELLGEERVLDVRFAGATAFIDTTSGGALRLLDGAQFLGKKLVARPARTRDRGGFDKRAWAAHVEKKEREQLARDVEKRDAERRDYLANVAPKRAAVQRLARSQGHFGFGFTPDGKRPRLHGGYANFDVT